MTNKLPEAGKKYRSVVGDVVVKEIRAEIIIVTEHGHLWSPSYFAENFEELPSETKEDQLQFINDPAPKANQWIINDKQYEELKKQAEIKEKLYTNSGGIDTDEFLGRKSQKDDKMQVALKELKEESNREFTYSNEMNCHTYFELKRKVENLINALDDSNIPETGFSGIAKYAKELKDLKSRVERMERLFVE